MKVFLQIITVTVFIMVICSLLNSAKTLYNMAFFNFPDDESKNLYLRKALKKSYLYSGLALFLSLMGFACNSTFRDYYQQKIIEGHTWLKKGQPAFSWAGLIIASFGVVFVGFISHIGARNYDVFIRIAKILHEGGIGLQMLAIWFLGFLFYWYFVFM